MNDRSNRDVYTNAGVTASTGGPYSIQVYNGI